MYIASCSSANLISRPSRKLIASCGARKAPTRARSSWTLYRLTFIDSTGVQLLMTAHARTRADSNRLQLLRGPRSVQRVLQICALEDRLPFAD
jgi:anti-anti-sigma factor